MLAEIGHLALILALCLAIVQGVVPLWGATVNDARLMAVARPAATAQFGFLLISFVALSLCFINNDFTVAYVAQNSNTALPVWYRVSAVWGGHEGSLLLWVLILSGWGLAVALASRALPLEMLARVLGVMGLISIGFLAFTQITSNPFERLLPGFPVNGRDLNPLLQDIGLIFHPPMLYMGYVGFSVAFAFVVAALLSGRLDSAWARWSRPWTTAAWCFLTLGISLGSFWAYYELGWGGWWFWDPVENASFMPWLAGTALVHSLAATEKRGVFRAWTVLLAIAAFSLSVLGTFLVRSGVLTSVHAFASDPQRGLFILGLLAVITGSALLLLLFRAHTIRSHGRFQAASRETFLLWNNLLLVGACGVVFVGTLFPLVVDILGLGKLSVGPPYFNTLFAPLTLVLLALMGIGPLLRWKRHDLRGLLRSLAPLAVLCAGLGVVLPLWFSAQAPLLVVLSVALALWVVATSLWDLADKLRHKRNKLTGLFGLSRSYVGMLSAHLGLAVMVVGVAVTSHYNVEKDVKMALEQPLMVGPYQFELLRLREYQGPNYTSTQGVIRVSDPRDGREFLMRPAKRIYTVQQMPMTEVALQPGLIQEIYVAMGEPLGDGSWAVRVHYKPFVRWLWLGSLIMAFGGFLAIMDPRYRSARQRQALPATPGDAHVARA